MAIVTTSTNKALFPDAPFRYSVDAIIPDALVLNGAVATVTGKIEGDVPVVRVPYVTADLAAGFVAEGAAITPGDPSLDELQVATGKIAVITRLSAESVHSSPGSLEIVTNSLKRSVTTKANTAFLANGAMADGPTGLLYVSGLSDGGNLEGGDLDAIADAITTVEAEGGTATAIVTDPESWGYIRSLKETSSSNVPLIGSPAEQAERRLFGVPVFVNAQAPVGHVLVIDKSEVIVATSMVEMAISADAYFNYDSYGVKVTMRLGWGVVHPERLCKINVPAVSHTST